MKKLIERAQRRINLAQLQYRVTRYLGAGAEGTSFVVEGKDKYVLKILHKEQTISRAVKRLIEAEIDSPSLYPVEIVDTPTLKGYLYPFEELYPITIHNFDNILKQACCLEKLLLSYGLFYPDLGQKATASNALVNQEGQLKIIDYGHSLMTVDTA